MSADFTVNAGIKIGFSANKTKEQAKANASDIQNRMVICKSKELYMNGQRLGLSDNEAEYIQRKVNEEYNAKAGLSISVSPSIQDAAAPTAVTVTVKTTWSGAATDADATPTVSYQGSIVANVPLTKSSTGVYTGVINAGNSTVLTLNCSAKIHGVNKSTTATIQAYHKIRFGVDASAGPLTSIPSGFGSKGPQSSAAGTYTFNFTDNTYGYILVPNGVSLPSSMQGDSPSGVEGPLPVPFTKLANLVVGGVTYTQLRIANKQAASVHNVVFK